MISVFSGFLALKRVPFKGELLHVEHVDMKRGVVEIKNGSFFVPGEKRYIRRRLMDWLKEQAKKEVSDKVYHYTKKINKKANRVSIKDTTSQWGSCSSKKNLSFSWRLIMAPPYVLEYVVAHEVAHMIHMNHSREFWSLVDDLYPDHKKARIWLKKEGPKLFKVLPKK